MRVVFDANGTIIGRMDYGPFGQALSGATNMPDRMYAGLFRDGEAELDAAGARSYQVRTGRFTTVDPVYAGLFEPQRWNRYSYALNTPLSQTDTSGLLSQGTTPGCNAEFSFQDCGGNAYFWGPPDEAGFGFGSGLAEAKRQGYFEGMPADMWDSLQQFNVRADAAFAEAQQAKREPKAGVEASYEIVMPDGSKVTDNPLLTLAKDIDGRTGDLTRPQVYGEMFIVSAAGGLLGRAAGALLGRTSLDGPSGTRLIQVRFASQPLVRVDYGPIPGSRGQPVLHLHVILGPSGMKTHWPIYPPGGPR